ncbi:MAG TPA: helix-turn-helix domain-containing protein [Planctomicrobium sp.]|nr:helix-turn-helix domain-containing protein [Planctomicrobium sp.]
MKLIQELESRRISLGMSRASLASRSQVSLPTVNRILSGKNQGVSLEKVISIAQALDMSLNANPLSEAKALQEREALKKAKRVVRLVQGTSAIEGQGLEDKDLQRMVRKTCQEILSSKQKLWAR